MLVEEVHILFKTVILQIYKMNRNRDNQNFEINRSVKRSYVRRKAAKRKISEALGKIGLGAVSTM